jgi:hypothetical protein
MTRTVAWLRAELAKFPDDAECSAYEGEVTGLCVGYPGQIPSGFIHCSEHDDADRVTELIPPQDSATPRAPA